MSSLSDNASARSKPLARLQISSIDLDPIETVEVFRNPTSFTSGVRVNWHRFQIPGLSHEPKHYVNTSNPVIPIELFYRAIRPGEAEIIADKIRFFDSLAYPIEAGSMPRVLVKWPKIVGLIMTVNSVDTSYTRFARDGRAIEATQRVEFEEIRDSSLVTNQEVRRFGLARAGTLAGREFFLQGSS